MKQVLIQRILLKKADLANLKFDVDKLDIDKLTRVPSNLRSLKSKVDKLVPIPVDLSKLSDVVKDDVVKKDLYNAKIRDIEDEIPDITNSGTTAAFKSKINEVKGIIPSITDLATNTAFTDVEDKIP